MGDSVQRKVVQTAENLVRLVAKRLDECQVPRDLVFHHSSCWTFQHQRFRVGIGDQFFAIAVFFDGVERKEILSAVHVEHAVERSPLEPASSPINGTQSVQAIAMNLIGANAYDRSVLEMKRLDGPSPSSFVVFQSQSPLR